MDTTVCIMTSLLGAKRTRVNTGCVGCRKASACELVARALNLNPSEVRDAVTP